jgi:FKBP-type peptidyl-prolyl cis-trans isomerase FklB
MKNILFAVLAAGLLITACDKSGGGSSASFGSQQDSIAYALGISLGQSTLNDGIKLSPEVLKQGYEETMNESTTMTQMRFQQSMQELQGELAARNRQPFTDQDPPKTNLDTVSYALGYNIATNLINTNLNFDGGKIADGYRDGIGGNAGLDSLTVTKMMNAMQELQRKGYEEKQRIDGENNQKEGEAFLAENRGKEGVVELPSGLQYKIERAGSGASPGAEDVVAVHYEGRLINGDVFDSSYEKGTPVEFPVGGVIAGWTEALQLMKPGAKWQLYIPGDQAYGLRGSPPKIGPNALLVFDVELLEVK